jgi:hypothetical protein
MRREMLGGTATSFGLALEPAGWAGLKHRFTVPTSGDASVVSCNYNGSVVDNPTQSTSSITVGNGVLQLATGSTNAAPTTRLYVNAAGNVGIGTSSPGDKVHIEGAGQQTIRIRNTTEGSNASPQSSFIAFRGYYNVALAQIEVQDRSASNFGGWINVSTSNSSNVLTNAIHIDSSQRVGIGTTPTQALDVNTGTNGLLRVFDTSNAALSLDRTGAKAFFIQSTGDSALRFYDFTASAERARIDSSGRLLVGTSSSIAAGSVTASTLQVSQGASGVGATLYSLANASGPGGILVLGHGRATAAGLLSSGDVVGQVRFAGGDGGDLETLAAQISVEVDGTPGANDMPGRLTFSTTADGASSPTERIRISSGGSILCGTTNADHRLTVYASDSSNVIGGRATSASYGATILFAGADRNTTNNSFYYFDCYNYGSSTYRFRIADSGNATNTNNSYGAISDIKLKENIVDANSQWDDLKALQVRNYNFKEGQTHTQIGLVAQEVELVSPGLVGESPDRDAEGNDLGTVTKSVNYSVLYMKAVKALQEAMERIETLEARLTAAGIE